MLRWKQFLKALFNRSSKTIIKKRERRKPRIRLWAEQLEVRLVPANFTPGDLVVLQVATSPADDDTASIVEYAPTGATQSAALTQAIDSTDANALFFDAGAGKTGLLSNSNDGTLVAFEGYNTTSGGTTVNMTLTRGVGTLNSSDAYTLAATYTGVSGNDTRSATSIDDSSWYFDDKGGLYTNGAVAPSLTTNISEDKAFGGAVYIGSASAASAVSTVSSPTATALVGLPGIPADSNLHDFYLVSSGSNGNTYDALYTLDETSASAGTINKFALISGTWTAKGSYTTTFGGDSIVAANNGGGGEFLYVTAGKGGSKDNSLLELNDTAAWNASINITTANNVTLATASGNNTFMGVAFAPLPAISTTTAITSVSPLTTTSNTAVAFKATVTGATSPTAGTVQFFSGATLLATGTYNGTNNDFEATSSTIPSGVYSNIEAFYVSGGGGFTNSNSGSTFGSTLTINGVPVFSGPTSATVLGGLGSAQLQTFSGVAASGGATFSLINSPPTWVSIDPNSGVLTFGQNANVPTETTTTPFTITIQATNGAGPVSETFTINVTPTINYATAGNNYTQNFGTLPDDGGTATITTGTGLPLQGPYDLTGTFAPPTTVLGFGANGLSGWYAANAAANPELFAAGEPGANTGALYDFNDGANLPALGTISTGTTASLFGAILVNNTGTTLNQFSLSYIGEEWWNNSGASTALDFSYELGATTLPTSASAGTAVPGLGFTAPVTTGTGVFVDGSTTDQTSVSGTAAGFTWLPGQTLAIFWDKGPSPVGSSAGLGVANVSFSASFVNTPAITSVANTTVYAGASSTFQVTASNSPTSYSLTGTPPTWVSISNAGVLSFANPQAVATTTTYSFGITATNNGGTSPAQTFTLTEFPTIGYSSIGSTFAQSFSTLPTNTGVTSATGTGSPTFGPYDLTTSATGAFGAAGLTGWYAANTNTAKPELFSEGQPAATTGALYDFNDGTAGSQALGMIATGSTASRFGAVLVNTTGETLDQFSLSYTGEEWWNNSGTSTSLNFSYELGASGGSGLPTGSTGYTTVASLGFTAPDISGSGVDVDGATTLADQVPVSGTVTGISWAPGQTLVIFWDKGTSPAGSSAGLGVANVSFAASSGPGITSAASTDVDSGLTSTFQVTTTSVLSPTFAPGGTVPSWVSLNPATGLLTFTNPPTVAAPTSFSFTITATDSTGTGLPQTFTVIDVPAGPSITSTASASVYDGVTGQTDQLAATGDGSTITYAISGSPPSWVSLNTSSGLLTFTPSAANVATTTTYTFTLTASDDLGSGIPQTFTLTELPTAAYATLGNTYTQNFSTLPDAGGTATITSGTGNPAQGPYDLTTSATGAFGATGLIGWYAANTASSAEKFAAGEPSASTGALFDFNDGNPGSQALGMIATGSTASRFGTILVNTTGTTLTQFTLSYTGEEWWNNSGTGTGLNFSYDLGATGLPTSLSAGTLVPSLGFSAVDSTGAGVFVDGSTTDQVPVSGTVTGISWAPGETLVIFWDKGAGAGSSDGLGVANLKFSAQVAPILNANTGLTVNQAATTTISNAMLNVSETGLANMQIVYTLGTPPSHGTLYDGETALTTTGSTFTQADIDNGLLTYANDGSVNISDAFTFTASDGANGAIPSTTFNITITPAAAPNVLINEIETNPPGTADNRYQYVELSGTPGEFLNNVYFVTFDGISGNNQGTADLVVNLSGDTIGSDGLLVIQSSASAGHAIPVGTTVVTDPSFFMQSGGFANGTLSFYLFSSTTAFVQGTDYDQNNNGTLDHLPSGYEILDHVAILDNNSGASGDIAYGTVVITESNSTGTPDAVTRIPGDTSVANSAWYGGELVDTGNLDSQINYDPTRASANEPSGAILTPGAVNVIPTTITWANPADITYGTALSGMQLDASASAGGNSVLGTFTYTLADDTTPASNAVLHAGQSQTLNVTFTPTGPNAAEYRSETASVVINVDRAILTASIINDPTKPYDGNTAATLTAADFSLGNLVGTDSFTVNQTAGTYNSKDTDATSISAILAANQFTAVGGTLASDYTFPTGATGPGAITAVALTTSIVNDPSKPYDGTTAATLTSANFHIGNLVGTDSFSVTQTAGTYDSKDTNATTVNATLSSGQFTALGSTDASDYTFPISVSGAGSITPVALTVSIIGDPTKPYDGTTAATLSSANFQIGNLVGSDNFSVTQTAGTYDSKDTNATTVNATLSSGQFTALGSTDTSDYTFPISAGGAGSITPVALTVSIIGDPTKPYDGTTAATLTSANFHIGNLVGTDNFSVTQSAGTYDSKDTNATTINATLSSGQFTALGSTDASDYTFPISVGGAGTITPVALTVSIIGDPTKPYDGTTAATLSSANFHIGNLVGTDNFSVTQTAGTYDSKDTNATTVNATLSSGQFTALGSTDTSDYTFPISVGGAGSVTPVALTVSIIGDPTKPYDGTTAATLSSANFHIGNLVGTDNFSVTQIAGTYDSKDTNATTVNATLSSGQFTALGSTDASDYTFPISVGGAGSITPVTLTVSIIGDPTKPYDGTTAAILSSANFQIGNLVGTDNFSITQTAGTYDSKDTNATTVNTTLSSGQFTALGSTVTSDYTFPTSASGLGAITAASQTIVFNVTSPAPYGAPVTLAATGGGSGNSVVFSVISGPGTLNGNTLTITGVGTIVIAANQAGNADYSPAAPVQRNLVVGTTFTSPVSENENGSPTPVKVSTVLGAHFSDSDASTKPGIAVFQTDGDGTWQFSTNGSTWTAIGSVSQTGALLLPGVDSLRFVPTANTSGQADLSFVAWDGSQGMAGGFFNIASAGSPTPFSTNAGTLAVTVNPEPIWTAVNAALPPITSVTSAPAGSTVATVFSSSFHDDNLSVSVGVAIVGATGTSGGKWQYSIDGANWTSFGAGGTTFGAVSAGNALLLTANDQIRFVPTADDAGTPTLQTEAWDGSQGTAAVFGATKGFKIPTGASGFSATTLTVTCLVNDAPTTGATGPTLHAATEGVASTFTVSSLAQDAQVHDVDHGAQQGIAIVGVGGAGQWPGAWQYSLNGKTWIDLPSVSESSAFLLPSTASLRFTPTVQLDTATNVNPVTLTYRAWDQTAGTSGTSFAVSATGGATSISSTEVTASLAINFVNHAPTWTSTSISLPAELPGSSPAGVSVASIFGSSFSDVDGDGFGIAIVTATGSGWQYSTDGANWTTFGAAGTTFGAVSTTNALLLTGSDFLRFVPSASFVGPATLKVNAWDGTVGAAAGFGATKGFKIPTGASAFSPTTLTVTCAVNDAPNIGAATGPTLPTANEGIVSTFTVSTLIQGAQITDVDHGAVKGIAIVGVGGAGQWPGAWQYSLNGKAWFDLPSVSESSAFLLANTASLRFTPTVQLDNATNVNPVTLTYRAWDQTAGTSGAALAVAATGGASSISSTEIAASLAVDFVNHAPTWTSSSISLPAELPGSSPAGASVASIFGSSFNDVDGNSVGVAIVGATGSGWQYSTDGTNWTTFGAAGTTFGAVSATNALLLTGDDFLRFVPSAGFAGPATLKVDAWDGTVGAAAIFGATKGFKIPAGASAFSATMLTVICVVNDAPTVGATGPTLPTANEGVANTFTVSSLALDAQVHDVDHGALQGIAIVGVGSAGQWPGAWQYSLNGKTWIDLPSVSESSAFLLASTASLRFTPTVQLDSATSVNPVTLTYRAWDQTAGTSGTSIAVSATGGTTSISSTEVTASLAVNFVDHAPTWTSSSVSLPAELPGSSPAGATVASIFGSSFSDVDGDSVGIAITAATGTINGTWEYSTDGTNWTSFGATGAIFGAVSAGNALLLTGGDFLRFVPKTGFSGSATIQANAWDGTQGTAAVFGATKGFAIPSGSTAFSKTLATASVAVNTAPVLKP